jgi:hypothetical protein
MKDIHKVVNGLLKGVDSGKGATVDLEGDDVEQGAIVAVDHRLEREIGPIVSREALPLAITDWLLAIETAIRDACEESQQIAVGIWFEGPTIVLDLIEVVPLCNVPRSVHLGVKRGQKAIQIIDPIYKLNHTVGLVAPDSK